MKKLIVFLVAILFIGCKDDMEILSSKKQTIISGIKTIKPYIKYVFKVNVKSDIDISIDKVLVVDSKECFELKPLIKKEGLPSYSEKINSKGIYYISAVLKEGSYTKKDDCISLKKDKVIVFYTSGGKQKKIEINSNSVVKEEKRMR
mgnify:CR=1 FL=1